LRSELNNNSINFSRLSIKDYEKDVADGYRFFFMILSNFIWHGFTIIVRAFSIALMLTVFPVQTSVFLLVHILIMYMFIAFVWKTSYCPAKVSFGRSILKLFYEIIGALVLTVTWVNFTPQKNSLCSLKAIQMTVYYIIVSIENAVFLYIWRVSTSSDNAHFDWPMLGIEDKDIDDLIIWCCGVLHLSGLFVMLLYYKCCHPTRDSNHYYNHRLQGQ
jgi:hypothetical protein